MWLQIAKCSCCGCTPIPISQLASQLAIYTYSTMKRVALASSQGIALLGFFPHAILFPQSQINDPDPQMFFSMIKRVFMSFFMDGVQLPQGQNHFEEAVCFLPLSSRKLLVLIFYQPLKDEQHKCGNRIQRKEYRFLCS